MSRKQITPWLDASPPFQAALSHPGLTDKNVHPLSGWTSHIVSLAAQVRNLG